MASSIGRGSNPFTLSWFVRSGYRLGKGTRLAKNIFFGDSGVASGLVKTNYFFDVAPTQVVRYVNTASSAGGDGTTNATAGANRAYASLNEAVNAEKSAFNSTNTRLTIYCEGSAADTAGVDFTGYASNASRYVEVVADQSVRHDGKWNTSKYRLEVTDGTPVWIATNGVRLVGLQIRLITSLGNGSDTPCVAVIPNGPCNIRFDACIFRASLSGSGNCSGIKANNSALNNWNLYIRNSVIYGGFTTGINIDSMSGRIYHTTIHGGSVGVAYPNSIAIKNTIVTGATTCFSGSGSSSDYNISSDATAPGAHSLTSATITYVDPANGDFHSTDTDLVVTNNLYSDPTLPVTVDIDGDPRPSVGSVYAGSDQPSASTKSGSDTPTVVITESKSLLVSLSRSDTPTVAISTSSSNSLSSSRTDNPTLSISETSSNALSSSRTDNPTVAVLEARSVAVSSIRTDTPTVAISESSSVLISTSRTDSVNVSTPESSTLLVALSRTETVDVSTPESSGNASTLARTDAPTVSIGDASTSLLALSRADTLDVALGESIGGGTADKNGTDAPTIALSESSAVFVSVAGTDAPAISLTESNSNALTLSRIDNPTVAVGDASTNLISVSRSDAPAVAVTESRSVAVVLQVADAPAVAVGAASSSAPTLSRSDSPTVAVTETRFIAATSSRNDAPAVALAAQATISVSAAGTDAPTVSLTESASVTVVVSRADALVVSTPETRSIAGTVSAADAPAVALSHGGTVAGTMSAADSPTVAVSESSSIFAVDVDHSLDADDLALVGLVESYQLKILGSVGSSIRTLPAAGDREIPVDASSRRLEAGAPDREADADAPPRWFSAGRSNADLSPPRALMQQSDAVALGVTENSDIVIL